MHCTRFAGSEGSAWALNDTCVLYSCVGNTHGVQYMEYVVYMQCKEPKFKRLVDTLAYDSMILFKWHDMQRIADKMKCLVG